MPSCLLDGFGDVATDVPYEALARSEGETNADDFSLHLCEGLCFGVFALAEGRGEVGVVSYLDWRYDELAVCVVYQQAEEAEPVGWDQVRFLPVYH